MSLGLPAHLAPQAVRRSFIFGQHAVALTLLILTFFSVLVVQSEHTEIALWPAAMGLIPAIALLGMRERTLSSLWSVSYLAALALGAFVLVTVALGQPEPILDAAGFSFLGVKIAAIMVGGGGIGSLAGIGWAVTGYLTIEATVAAATVIAGGDVAFDGALFLVVVAAIIVIPIINPISRRQLVAQPRIHSAAQDELLAALRYKVEIKAAALMHDTVLNHLAAIADSKGEELGRGIAEQVRRDVESLVGEDWLTEAPTHANARSRLEWQHSGLFTAIQEGRMLGLEIETTGDLTAVGRLDRATSIALGLAVKQCLVNVIKHSGTEHAEVAVYGSGQLLSVLVVDSGLGFDESATTTSRFGLRVSVRKRMESVGGRVDVWSTPGRGTSIMIQVPLRDEHANIPAFEGGEPSG